MKSQQEVGVYGWSGNQWSAASLFLTTLACAQSPVFGIQILLWDAVTGYRPGEKLIRCFCTCFVLEHLLVWGGMRWREWVGTSQLKRSSQVCYYSLLGGDKTWLNKTSPVKASKKCVHSSKWSWYHGNKSVWLPNWSQLDIFRHVLSMLCKVPPFFRCGALACYYIFVGIRASNMQHSTKEVNHKQTRSKLMCAAVQCTCTPIYQFDQNMAQSPFRTIIHVTLRA